jgi:hypothetical protein
MAAVVWAPGGKAPPVEGLTWLLFVGSSVHVASTGWLYTLPDVRGHVGRNRARYVWIPIGLVATAAVTAAVVSPAILAWPLLGYFGWQFFHFQKQNMGMAALAATSHGVMALTSGERRALTGTGTAGIAALVAHPGLLPLPVDPRIGAVFGLAGVGFVIGVGGGLVALRRRPAPERPVGFCVVYLLALFFSLPIFVFRSPYAAVGGMTAAHGLQYLLLVGLVAAGARDRTTRGRRLFLLFNVALLGGAVLGAASHLHGGAPVTRLVFGAYLGAVMAHFVVDGGLWRLRQPFPRSFMARYLPGLVAPSGVRPRILADDGPRILADDGSSTEVA